MYILLADSGSTKTDWILLKDNEIVKQVFTIGFNPYFQNKDQISNAIYAQLLPHISADMEKISKIYYYGAGCSNPENCNIVKQGISNIIKVNDINISHDLLAASRALCLDQPGIAGILGTGSNSCLYDGKNILENVPSVGYMWGDHGSGASIGKKFLAHFFNDELPLDIKERFEKEGYHREEILNNVYKKSMPSKYLASMSLFIGKHLENDFIKKMIISCFEEFFTYQISKYTNATKYPISTVGSIGFIYKDLLKIAAENKGYKLGTIIKSPLEGLIKYHQNYQ
jgi:N-acetylglucosamine kinase-like BadF-type ATPase